ncbi:MAG: hypothetical protein JNL96_15720 [Planctomycetaceae bacterium]|nr:hypothetical protein [Planctomycetaceae bacterium]
MAIQSSHDESRRGAARKFPAAELLHEGCRAAGTTLVDLHPPPRLHRDRKRRTAGSPPRSVGPIPTRRGRRLRAIHPHKVRYPHEWKPEPGGPLTDLAWTLATSLTTRMFAPLFLLYLASPLLRDATRVGPRRTQKCRTAE